MLGVIHAARKNLPPFVVPVLVFCTPIAVVLVWPIFFEFGSDSAAATTLKFTNAIRHLPTQTSLYAAIAALVGASLTCRWWQFRTLNKGLAASIADDHDHSGLIPRDWLVVLALRRRALSLRTRADLLLIGVFSLLFGGIYLILFILPGIEEV